MEYTSYYDFREEIRTALELKYNAYFEGLYDSYAYNLKDNLSPSSKRLNDACDGVIQCFRSLRDLDNDGISYSSSTSNTFRRGLVGDELSSADTVISVSGSYLEPELDENANTNVQNEHSDVIGLIQSIYSEAGNSYFYFSGKNQLHDMVVLDERGYLDYHFDISSQLHVFEYLQTEINKFEELIVNDNYLLSNIKPGLDELYDIFCYEKSASFNQTISALFDEVIADFPYNESKMLDTTLEAYDVMVLELKHYFTSLIEPLKDDLFTYVETMIDEVNKLQELKTLLDGHILDIELLLTNLEDINMDLERKLNDLEEIKFSDRTSYVESIIAKTKEDYIASGEYTDGELSDNSVFVSDKDFVNKAVDAAEVDILFDMGAIDVAYRSEVTIDNVEDYLDIEKMNTVARTTTVSSIESNTITREEVTVFNKYHRISLYNYVEASELSTEELYEDEIFTDSVIIISVLDNVVKHEYFDTIEEININGNEFAIVYIEDKPAKEFADDRSLLKGLDTSDWVIKERITSNNVVIFSEDNRLTYRTQFVMEKEYEINQLKQELNAKQDEMDGFFAGIILDELVDLSEEKLRDKIGDTVGFIYVDIVLDAVRKYEELQEEIEQLEGEVKGYQDALSASGKLDKHEYANYYQHGVAIVANTDDNILKVENTVIIPNKETVMTNKAVENSYIISQGEGTPGYEEAMNWSYEVAVSNGYKGNYYLFSENYKLNVVDYESDLQGMQGKDIDWMVDQYDTYENVFTTIENNLHIINPTND